MRRLKRFLGSILEDILPEDPVFFAAAIVSGVIAVAVIAVPVAGLAWLISDPGGDLIEDGALEASVAIWMLFIALLLLVDYLKQKWKESFK